MLILSYRVTKFFLDRPLVIARIGKAKARSLRRAGGAVRTRARRSLRRRKRPSAPGTPPSTHSKDPVATLRNILYAYDENTSSVIVGPVGLNQVNDRVGGGTVTIPELHEKGGELAIREWRFKDPEAMAAWAGWARFPTTRKFTRMWRREDRRWRNRARARGRHSLFDLGVERRIRKAKYPARPYMLPAMEKEQKRFPNLFYRSVSA